ncbi:single-stranded DNA-binding protein [Levilactobacillus brevis]|uniref:single-stranded DNA-binding protein n=1 Tax=Levilactobacillus brevis TaxID=1580 RepID=UPI0020CBC07A|nr:single-stranded DNA-binding protein [Levilactobacillus brevis]MCP9614760.1 single-stranded DNA-binding protein [Levilactobacillus brevis]
MINNVTLTGRLGKDVELKYTESGLAVASGTLAVSRRFQTKNGEREVDWINFVIWRKAAEAFANFTHKGSLVGLEGRIQTRNYENQQGQRVYVTEVIVENFSFLESKNSTGNGSYQNNRSQNNTSDPFANNGESIDIQDSSLPFLENLNE